MAMEAGLDAAIINPKEKAMMDAWRSAQVLLNRDPQSSGYIAAYAGQQASVTTPAATDQPLAIRDLLSLAIINGDREGIVALIEQALAEGLSPMQVSNEGLLPGLEEVGRRFEKISSFCPR